MPGASICMRGASRCAACEEHAIGLRLRKPVIDENFRSNQRRAQNLCQNKSEGLRCSLDLVWLQLLSKPAKFVQMGSRLN